MKPRPRESFDPAAPLYSRRSLRFRTVDYVIGADISALPVEKRRQLHRIGKAQHAAPRGLKRSEPIALTDDELEALTAPDNASPAAPSAGPSPQTHARTDAQATSHSTRRKRS